MTRFIGVVTIFPEAFTALTDFGVVGKALKSAEVQLQFFNPRDYSQDKHRRVDDQPYGGGPGMLLSYQPLAACLDAAIDACLKAGHKPKPPVIFFSPQGTKLRQGEGSADGLDQQNQPQGTKLPQDDGSSDRGDRQNQPQGAKLRQGEGSADGLDQQNQPQGTKLPRGYAASYAELPAMILLSGCYEGIDERIIESYVDEQLSIGDYVLSSGDLAIMVFINVVARLWQPTLGNELSAKHDSFSAGLDGLLEEPYYTRPELIEEPGKHARRDTRLQAPSLLSRGNHAEIAKWQRAQALKRTWHRRPDLLAKRHLTLADKKLLLDYS